MYCVCVFVCAFARTCVSVCERWGSFKALSAVEKREIRVVDYCGCGAQFCVWLVPMTPLCVLVPMTPLCVCLVTMTTLFVLWLPYLQMMYWSALPRILHCVSRPVTTSSAYSLYHQLWASPTSWPLSADRWLMQVSDDGMLLWILILFCFPSPYFYLSPWLAITHSLDSGRCFHRVVRSCNKYKIPYFPVS